MTVIALAAVKSSPGTTTVALALTLAWPDDAVLVEADPDGGVLAARLGMRSEPSLSTYAAAVRRPDASPALASHFQRSPLGPRILLGAASPEQSHVTWSQTGRVADALAREGAGTLIVDCGRLTPSSPLLPLAHAADLVVIVSRPRLDEIQHLVQRTTTLREQVPSLAVLLVGRRPYPPGDVAAVLPVPVLGVIDDDPAGAEMLNEGRGGRFLVRTALIRSAHQLAVALRAAVPLRRTLVGEDIAG